MKKLLVTLLVLVLCFTAFAGVESKLNVYGGTSYMVSHVGASYNLGQWEFGGTLYSAFPNVGIIGYVNEMKNYDPSGTAEKPNLLKLLGESFTLGYAANVSASYDVIPSASVDLNLGLSLSGMYTEFLKDLLGVKFGIVSADVTMKLQFNFSKHNGIYVATELPLAGVLISQQTTEESGTTVGANFFTVAMEGYPQAALSLVIYTTRVGYVYRF